MLVMKVLVWVAFVAFLAYTVFCSVREPFFKSARTMLTLHWGRQVGLDLYLGLALVLFVVYLNERSPVAVLLWGVPTVLFGNLATLLYVALHFDSLAAHFPL